MPGRLLLLKVYLYEAFLGEDGNDFLKLDWGEDCATL